MIELDLAQLTVSSTVTDLKSCITNMEEPETLKTDVMTTTIDMSERTIGKVIDDSKDHYYPIPIFALPTANAFSYKATVCFYHKGIPVLTMSGLSKGPATGLNPAGLNILDFDHDKIVL
jgi:hypothetical protein